MPVSLSTVTTRSGHLVLRSEFAQDVSVEEARDFLARLEVGGPYDGTATWWWARCRE